MQPAHEVGDKILAVSWPPYHPMFGHNTEVVPKFIEIEVTQIHKDVPYEFSEEKGYGYVGVGSDGYLYAKDYPRKGDGWGPPAWKRWLPDSEFRKLSKEEQKKMTEDYMWQDITDYQCPAKAKVAEKFPYIDYCEEHQEHYYIREGCFRCQHNLGRPDVIMNLQEHAWLGWHEEAGSEFVQYDVHSCG